MEAAEAKVDINKLKAESYDILVLIEQHQSRIQQLQQQLQAKGKEIMEAAKDEENSTSKK